MSAVLAGWAIALLVACAWTWLTGVLVTFVFVILRLRHEAHRGEMPALVLYPFWLAWLVLFVLAMLIWPLMLYGALARED